MDYNELLKKAKDKNIDNLEILEQTTEQLTIETFDNRLDNYEVSNVTSYKIKAQYNNKEISITTELLDETVLDKLIKNSAYLEAVTNGVPPQSKDNIVFQKEYTINNSQKIMKKILQLNKLKQEYINIKSINCLYQETISKIKMITEDSLKEDIKKTYYFGVEVIATKNGKTSTFSDYKNSTQDNINIESLVISTIETAVSKLECGEVKSGEYNILLTNKVITQILNCFIPIFSADTIQKHKSLLEGKLNEKVFSEKITLIEDPTNSQMIGKRLFDDEGIKTTYKEIIKEGIFKNILYDNKTARIDNKSSTGNNYGTISVRNMYLLPGTKSKEEILEKNKKYIIIDEVNGLHAGINLTNGDISIQSNGFFVNNDKKIPIKLFVLSTNIMDLLNNIAEIANDLENISTTISAPSIFIKNIKISV